MAKGYLVRRISLSNFLVSSSNFCLFLRHSSRVFYFKCLYLPLRIAPSIIMPSLWYLSQQVAQIGIYQLPHLPSSNETTLMDHGEIEDICWLLVVFTNTWQMIRADGYELSFEVMRHHAWSLKSDHWVIPSYLSSFWPVLTLLNCPWRFGWGYCTTIWLSWGNFRGDRVRMWASLVKLQHFSSIVVKTTLIRPDAQILLFHLLSITTVITAKIT